MKKTTLTITVEHYEDSEFISAIREVYERIANGYVSGHYLGENELEVEFKTEEIEA